MSKHPTPWRAEPDMRHGVHASISEKPSLVGWNVVDANGVEIVGEEGMMADAEAAANHLVQAVNAHAEVTTALRDAERHITWVHSKLGSDGKGDDLLQRIRRVLDSLHV